MRDEIWVLNLKTKLRTEDFEVVHKNNLMVEYSATANIGSFIDKDGYLKSIQIGVKGFNMEPKIEYTIKIFNEDKPERETIHSEKDADAGFEIFESESYIKTCNAILQDTNVWLSDTLSHTTDTNC